MKTSLFSAMILAALAMSCNITAATEVPGGIAAKNAKGDFVYYDFALKQSTVLVDAATFGDSKEYAASEDAGTIFFVKNQQLIMKTPYQEKLVTIMHPEEKIPFWPNAGIRNLDISPKAKMFCFETEFEDKNYVFVDKKSPEGRALLRIGFPRNAFVPAGAPIFIEGKATCNSVIVRGLLGGKDLRLGNTAIYPGAIPFIRINKQTGKLEAIIDFFGGAENTAYGGMDLSRQDTIQRFARRRHAKFGCFSPDEEFFVVALQNDDESFDRLEIRSLSTPDIGTYRNERGVISSTVMPTVKPGIYEIPLFTQNIKGLSWTRPEKGKPASLTVQRGQSVYRISGEKISEGIKNSGIQRGRGIKNPPTPINNILQIKFEFVTNDIDTAKICWISDSAFLYRDNASGELCLWDNGSTSVIMKKITEKYSYCPQPVSKITLAQAMSDGKNTPKTISGAERVQEATNSSGELSIGSFKGLEFITEDSKSIRVQISNNAYCIVDGKVDPDLTNHVCEKVADINEGQKEKSFATSLPKDLQQYKYYERRLQCTVMVPLNKTLIIQNDVGDRLAIKPTSLEQNEGYTVNTKLLRKRYKAELVPDVFEYVMVEWKFQPKQESVSVAGKPTTTK